MEKIKNIDKAEILVLKEQVAYQSNQVVSRTLAQNNALSVTLFSFDKGEEISSHESSGDAFVICLDGVGEITIDDKKYELHEGESIVMPAKHPHAVLGKEQFKMLAGLEVGDTIFFMADKEEKAAYYAGMIRKELGEKLDLL